MTKDEIITRIDTLRNVFAFSIINGGLSIGQRICLSQERAHLIKKADRIDTNPLRAAYQLPAYLELKVRKINETITNTGWVKPPHKTII